MRGLDLRHLVLWRVRMILEAPPSIWTGFTGIGMISTSIELAMAGYGADGGGADVLESQHARRVPCGSTKPPL
jgi:hypothetical protein